MNVFVQIHLIKLYEANRGFRTPPPVVTTSQQTSALLKCPWTRHWSSTSCRADVQSLKLPSDVSEQGQTKTNGINQYKGTQTSPGCLRVDSGSCIITGNSEPDSHHTHHTHMHAQCCYVFNDIIRQSLLHSPVLRHLRESFIKEQCTVSALFVCPYSTWMKMWIYIMKLLVMLFCFFLMCVCVFGCACLDLS